MQLASILTPRREDVSLGEDGFSGWTPITIHFDGVIEPRNLRGKEGFKGRLFAVCPGDLVFSKIDARNGAIGLLPASISQAVVTAEYPVYNVDEVQVEPEYLALLLRTDEFRRRVNDLVSGTSGRKRVEPDAFVGLGIPLPPLETQRAIVARWQQAQAEVKTLEQQAIVVEEQSGRDFQAALGLADLPGLGDLAGLRPRVFALWWSESDRWSVEPNRLRKLGFQETPQSHYPSLPISTFGEVIYGLQVCPEREPRDYPTPYLRVANVQRGYLDLIEIKQIEVAPQELAKYQLEPGDILLCEGNSAELVGRGATWQGEIEGCVHQNHVLRVRLDLQKALPEYVLAYINSSAGQTYFRSKAKRTTNLASINSREVGRMPVPLPPLDVQREIVRRVEESRAEIARLRAQAARRAQEAQAEVEAAILGNEDLPGF